MPIQVNGPNIGPKKKKQKKRKKKKDNVLTRKGACICVYS